MSRLDDSLNLMPSLAAAVTLLKAEGINAHFNDMALMRQPL